MASDFDKVVWTEPQARASQSVLTSAFMAGMSQRGPASGSRGLQASGAHGDHRPHGALAITGPRSSCTGLGTSPSGRGPASSTAEPWLPVSQPERGFLPLARELSPLPQGHLGNCWLSPAPSNPQKSQPGGLHCKYRTLERTGKNVGACSRQVNGEAFPTMSAGRGYGGKRQQNLLHENIKFAIRKQKSKYEE